MNMTVPHWQLSTTLWSSPSTTDSDRSVREGELQGNRDDVTVIDFHILGVEIYLEQK